MYLEETQTVRGANHAERSELDRDLDVSNARIMDGSPGNVVLFCGRAGSKEEDGQERGIRGGRRPWQFKSRAAGGRC